MRFLDVGNKGKIKACLLLFAIALLARIVFYLLGSAYLPDNFQRFVTADTKFYYDPIALGATSEGGGGMSFLQSTRAVFLSYLSSFYHYFGHIHWPVSVFHCVLGAFSVALLFLFSDLFLARNVAYVVGLVASLHVVWVYWTPFVATEASFFFVFSLCLYLSGLFVKTRRALYALFLLFALAILSVSRPSGLSFSLFLAMYLQWLFFGRVWSAPRNIIYYVLANGAIFVSVFLILVNIIPAIDKIIAQPYPQELLSLSLYMDQVDGSNVEGGNLKIHSARLTLPPGISIPNVRMVPFRIRLVDVFSYFRYHSDKYFMLVISRIYTLFNPWVPEYSLRHNLFNVVFYGSIYLLSVIGIVRLWKERREFSVIVLLALCSQTLLVALTIVDYDFRLRLPIEFVLTVPVGYAISRLFVSVREPGDIL